MKAAAAVASALLALLASACFSVPTAREGRLLTVKVRIENCTWPTGKLGILEIPSLGLSAYVEEGDSDQVLEEAIGHNPLTASPGSTGTAELSAHDVTQFSQLWRLGKGDDVYFYPGCGVRAHYRVVKREVISTDQPVYTWPRPALLLETCWPPYTLSLTQQRLLIYAQLVDFESVASLPSVPTFEAPAASIPAGYDPSFFSLANNWAPMGFMSFAGSPSIEVLQSPLPLKAEEAALELYFAAIYAQKMGDARLFGSIAPGLSLGDFTWLAGIKDYLEPVNVVETFSGAQLMEVELETTVRLLSEEVREVSVDATVNDGSMYLTSIAP